MPMKKKILVVITFFTFCTCWAQSPLDERVDFQVTNSSVADALRQLSAATQIDIAFSDQFFAETAPLNLQFQQSPIREILLKILEGTTIDFKLIDAQLVLFRATRPPPAKRHTISGYIEDASTGEALIGATVYSQAHQKGTLSNEYGFFSLTLPAGETQLTYSYLGAQAKRQSLALQKNAHLRVALDRSILLSEVIVTPTDSAKLSLAMPIAAEHIRMEHLQVQPDVGGETDLIRSAQLMPGVQSGADGWGGLYVRGGNADQNLMLLDGVPVYNVSHLLGLFSIYNTDAIRSARLLKGHFPARFGNRISSVFDVRTREGNQKAWTGSAALGLISGTATIEGPIAKKKGAVLLSYRRTHSNFLLDAVNQKAFMNAEQGSTFYQFSDFNAKINYTFSPQDRVFLSFYQGNDDFGMETSEETDEGIEESETNLSWGNLITALRWNHLFSDQLFSNTTLTYSRYRYNNSSLDVSEAFEPEDPEEEDFFFYEFASDNQDWAIKTDFEYLPSPGHYIRFGAGYTRHEFNPGVTILDENSEVDVDSIALTEFENIFEAPIILADEWACLCGRRNSTFSPMGSQYRHAVISFFTGRKNLFCPGASF